MKKGKYFYRNCYEVLLAHFHNVIDDITVCKLILQNNSKKLNEKFSVTNKSYAPD